jgi:spore coat polysaccharide biosynthesis predicted glycosyltransferase SpsG
MIIIRAEDRPSFGWGHRSRATALWEAAALLDVRCTMLVSDDSWGQLLKADGAPCKTVATVDGTAAEARALIAQGATCGARAIVLDGNRFTPALIQALTNAGLLVVLVDDNGVVPRPADIVVNPNIYATSELYQQGWKGSLHLGERFILLRKAFAQRPVPAPKEPRALCSLGGAATAALSTAVATTLEQAGYQVRFAAGLTATHMVEAMDNSSVVVCGASVTLHEVWSRRRVAIPIYQAIDQRNFRTWCTAQGIAVVDALGVALDDVCVQLDQVARRCLQDARSQHATHASVPAVDAQGAIRVLTEVVRGMSARTEQLRT